MGMMISDRLSPIADHHSSFSIGTVVIARAKPEATHFLLSLPAS
jgi:hypothetical protein